MLRPSPTSQMTQKKTGQTQQDQAGWVLVHWTQSLVPKIFSSLIFIIGAVLLISVFAPIDPQAMPIIKTWLPLGLVEASHILGTIIGVLMIFLSRGLWERLDSAWFGALILFLLGAVFSLTRELDLSNAFIMLVCALLLLPCKPAFHRKSNLLHLGFNRFWLGITALGFISIIWIGFYIYQNEAYAEALWGLYAYEASVSRFLRALVVMVVTLIMMALYRLFGLARFTPQLPDDEDVRQLETIVPKTSQPLAWLALLRDKHILWNESRTAFVMYGVSGKHWIIMGEPIGPRLETEPLCWRLKELADLAAAKLSFYQVPPASLPLVLDMGLSPYKIGEEALVRPHNFDLAGKKGYGFRQTLRKFESLEAHFEVLSDEALSLALPRLKEISDAWLKAKGAKEKAYSLGCFDEAYIKRTPVAVVKIKDKIMAFANLLTTKDGSLISIDLMRYDPQSPPAIMDYVFLRLVDYARIEGIEFVSLGLAPLAGFEANPLSNGWYRLATLISWVGGEFYNFGGLRAYKQKFHPQWEPRYFAIKGRETALIPALMALMALGQPSKPKASA